MGIYVALGEYIWGLGFRVLRDMHGNWGLGLMRIGFRV